MTKLEKIDAEIKKLQDQKAALEKKKTGLVNNKMLKCGKCEKTSKISSYSRLYLYSYSYAHDDYFQYSEIGLICPKCSYKNRFLSKKEDMDFERMVNRIDFADEFKEYNFHGNISYYRLLPGYDEDTYDRKSEEVGVPYKGFVNV